MQTNDGGPSNAAHWHKRATAAEMHNEALCAALARLWPVLERAMSGLVFTADRAGEVQADMNTLRASLKRPNV